MAYQDPLTLRRRLPAPAKTLLDCQAAGRTQGGTLQSIANYCANNGFELEDYERVVRSSLFWDDFRLTDTEKRRHDQLINAWATASDDERRPALDAAGIKSALTDLRSELAAATWTGRNGTTDRVVSLAVLDWAVRIGAYTVHPGAREIAKMCPGYGRKAVDSSLRRLRKLGLLRRQQRDYGGRNQAAGLRVVLDFRGPAVARSPSGLLSSRVNFTRGEPGNPPARGLPGAVGVKLHDAFVRGALGVTAGIVWTRLPDEPVTARQTADLAGVTPNTARNSLDRLAKAGLAARDDGRPARYTRIEADLDPIAESYGKQGHQQRVIAQIEDEQREYRENRLPERIADQEREAQREAERRASAVDPFGDDCDDQPYVPFDLGISRPMEPMPSRDPFLDAGDAA